MTTKRWVMIAAIASVCILAVSTCYALYAFVVCDTAGARPGFCRPANNRCTPPGDPNEGLVDCQRFKYYKPIQTHTYEV